MGQDNYIFVAFRVWRYRHIELGIPVYPGRQGTVTEGEAMAVLPLLCTFFDIWLDKKGRRTSVCHTSTPISHYNWRKTSAIKNYESLPTPSISPFSYEFSTYLLALNKLSKIRQKSKNGHGKIIPSSSNKLKWFPHYSFEIQSKLKL